jgi:polyisoprenoid-binding protein YceI
MTTLTLARALACSFAVVILVHGTVAFGDEPRAIDSAKSKAQFTVQHVFVEHVTGTVPIVSGTVVLEPDSVIPVSATAVLDAGKVQSSDRDRDESLRSPDFFDVKKFPMWTFTSTKITPEGPAAFGMDGTLTVHGLTQPEHLDVTVRGDAAHPEYRAAGTIDRHAFGMTVTRIDPAIGGIASITLDIVLR